MQLYVECRFIFQRPSPNYAIIIWKESDERNFRCWNVNLPQFVYTQCYPWFSIASQAKCVVRKELTNEIHPVFGFDYDVFLHLIYICCTIHLNYGAAFVFWHSSVLFYTRIHMNGIAFPKEFQANEFRRTLAVGNIANCMCRRFLLQLVPLKAPIFKFHCKEGRKKNFLYDGNEEMHKKSAAKFYIRNTFYNSPRRKSKLERSNI